MRWVGGHNGTSLGLDRQLLSLNAPKDAHGEKSARIFSKRRRPCEKRRRFSILLGRIEKVRSLLAEGRGVIFSRHARGGKIGAH